MGRAAIGLCAAFLLAACGPEAPPAPPIATATATAETALRRLGTAAARTTPSAPTPVGTGASPTPVAPTPTPTPAVAYVSDYCVVRDWLTPYHGYDVHALTVLDPTYALPADYVPPDLVPVSTTGLVSERGDELVRAALVDDLAALHDAAAAAGLSLLVESAYRSYAQQQETLNTWVARIGYDAAIRRVARPGHSEHQLGTALDFTSPGWTGRFGDWAVESPEGAWLAAHAWEFGFVMSYPAGADAVTCFGYEPWHYRWVGRELAAEWVRSGVTLHEFLVIRGSTGG